jgi:N-acetylglucosaminyl-diphospho-decaprenol L-rhamnosyltransferase
MSSMAADIVIVNWNSRQMLADCVRSIDENPAGVGQVIVVDNGSIDGSDQVSSTVRPVNIIRTGRNNGFAKACNIGAAHCGAPYILFLNPDAELVGDGLPTVLNFMGSPAAARVGICGVQLVGEDGAIQRHCARFTDFSTYFGHATGLNRILPKLFTQHFMTDFDHRSNREVDQVIGAYYLIRTELFRALGGFDERFFVYFEEVDLALRAKQKGWSTYFLADAKGFHHGGGTSEQVKAHRLFYSLRSRIQYARKHFSPPAAWGTVAITLLIEPASRLARSLARRSKADVRNTVQGYAMLWRALPAILRRGAP